MLHLIFRATWPIVRNFACVAGGGGVRRLLVQDVVDRALTDDIADVIMAMLLLPRITRRTLQQLVLIVVERVLVRHDLACVGVRGRDVARPVLRLVLAIAATIVRDGCSAVGQLPLCG